MQERHSEKIMSNTSKNRKSIWDPAIVRGAAINSVLKLNPRKMMGNPVMFVVEVGSVITSILLILRPHEAFKFNLQITLWLWFTVMFANFAEAMAEGRGKAQADTLRKARSETIAIRLLANGTTEQIASSSLRAQDVVLVTAGEFIPGDGEIIDGIASVDESAITGESAPVIRGNRRHASIVGPDQSKNHFQSWRDFPRSYDCPRGRRRTAENSERDCTEHTACRAYDCVPARGGDAATVRDVFGRSANGVRVGFTACMPYSDDDWRIALSYRNCWHGQAGATQCARHVWTRR
jgi:hypothetical protein